MIRLPQITQVRLFNYHPLLKQDLKLDIAAGCFLILGGNGLGKTTILQSIIYCIAGPLDTPIEPERRQRWDSSYFRGRIDSESAFVEVDFILGEQNISVRRGFNNSLIRAVKIGDEEWITDPIKRQENYEYCVLDAGNYRTFDDFRYIIHKLIYLPEIRPNLAWDKDAQTRIFMTLCSDIIDEKVFRDNRKRLKETDSRKRKLHWDLEIARKSLATIANYNENEDIEDIEEDEEEQEFVAPQVPDVEELVEKLKNAAEIRRWHQKEISDLQKKLSAITLQSEKLNEKVSQLSESFILENISAIENKEVTLALHKLISLGLCPACGTKAPRLQIQAKKFIVDSCPLCGERHEIISSSDLSIVHSQLSEVLKKKNIIERDMLKCSEMLMQAEAEERQLQAKYDQYRLTVPILTLSNCDTLPGKKEELQYEFERINNLHNEFVLRCIEMTSELEGEYNRFHQDAGNRIQRLSELYQTYASSFLGKECSLEQVEADDRLLDLSLFVPKFDDKERNRSSECSEAQRFFLDIAFRMSIIHLASEQTNSAVSFICETPENALDMSYIDNVASMFHSFSKDGRSIILTANLQPGSVAKPILENVSPHEKEKHYVNMLEYGKLSEVQEKKLGQLMKVLKEIVG